MAHPDRRLPANVPGPVYVDDRCIDCGACRWMAPDVFDRRGGMSRVHTQPVDPTRAAQAAIACPTASIGAPKEALKHAAAAFPRVWTDRTGAACAGAGWTVHHCGFHSEDSYGATSWLLVQEDGPNVLVDSPRYSRRLAAAMEALGGVDAIFLTHRDDVADHDRWAAHFDAPRWIHATEADAAPGAERVFEASTELATGLRVLVTPGHTRGSSCLLAHGVLFSGDTLAWSPTREHVIAFRGACWYSWAVLKDTVEALQARPFTWLLPGHGAPVHLSRAEMAASLSRCRAWMDTV